jgi:hypothetical protein
MEDWQRMWSLRQLMTDAEVAQMQRNILDAARRVLHVRTNIVSDQDRQKRADV